MKWAVGKERSQLVVAIREGGKRVLKVLENDLVKWPSTSGGL